jgi:hypothetical protein
VGSDPVDINLDGAEALGSYEELPVGVELLEYWENKLPKAEASILRTLAKHPGISRERLAELTGYAADGGGFGNALSRLRTLELIERGGSEMHLKAHFLSAITGIGVMPKERQS